MKLNEIEREKQTITELLADFGIRAKLILEENSPNKINYHLNLYDITKITVIPKIIKYLEAYLHTEVEQIATKIGHFALAVTKQTRNKVNFNEKRIEKAISSAKELSVFVGVDEHNQPKMIPLNELPHLLIGGTTGSGKSTLLHNIITSLIMQSKKHEFELVLLDPKRVEFSRYKDIKEMGVPIAHTPDECLDLLERVSTYIDIIYERLQERGLTQVPKNESRTIVVIDEFADLMLLAKDQVERYLVRIAQLGRACGVHLILATQRPSADVVTGLIKANIPSRIALKTASYRDSMIILDKKGAENLLSRGDMLVKTTNDFEFHNVQCPYIDDEMIEKIIGGKNE